MWEDEPPHPTAKEPEKSSSPSIIVKRLRRSAGTQKRSKPARTTVPERASMAELAVELEVMVTVAVAGAEVEMSTLFPAAKEQVGISFAPLGEEARAQLRLTCPVNPPAGVTVMVDVPLAPRLATVTAVPVSEKPAGTEEGLTVAAMVVVATTVLPWVAFTVI